MQRLKVSGAILFVSVALLVAMTMGGCGGGATGGGTGANAAGILIATSFSGNEVIPCNPNQASPLPQVFIDETLEFTFDGPIDITRFGGFFQVAGQPLQLLGVSPTVTSGGVPYYPFANQALAQQSIQVRTNALNAPLLGSYIVGRHTTKLNTLVVDPRVSTPNALGAPFNAGFQAATQYTYYIPPNSNLWIGNVRALSRGVSPLQLPLAAPVCSTQPAIAQIFDVGAGTGPDPIPPSVVSVTSGTLQNPMTGTDSIVVTFTKAIDGNSLDQLVNFTVRNVTLNNSIVPGDVVVQAATPNIATFTPSPSYGPLGYSIQVKIVGVNTLGIAPVLGRPQGSPPQQLALNFPSSNVAGGTVTNGILTVNLTSAVCPTCVASTSVVEDFASLSGRDAAYVAQFNPAAWNAAFDAGFLGGCQISGSPLATYQGNPGNLGTRFQRVLTPTVQFIGTIGGTTNPPGLVAPFDTPLANLGAAVNPQGGSHIMHIYEAIDLGGARNSLELVEYGAVQNFINIALYPGYVAWAGMSNIVAPAACPLGQNGLSSLYSFNYNVSTPQVPDPLNLNPPNNNGNCPMSTATPAAGSMGGVRVTNPAPFNCGPGFTTYYPFPAFTQPFDYMGSGVGVGALIFEQNFDPNTLIALNLNRYRSAANTPARRIVGPPKAMTPNCFSGINISAAAGCDIYDMRFTFVPLAAAARSTFYDTNITVGSPIYESFSIAPSPASQPAGTNAVWQLEGANAILSPTNPSGPTTGMLTYYTGTPATGTTNQLVLRNTLQPTAPQLTGRRYFRFLANFRNNAATNGRQRYSNFVMAISN